MIASPVWIYQIWALRHSGTAQARSGATDTRSCSPPYRCSCGSWWRRSGSSPKGLVAADRLHARGREQPAPGRPYLTFLVRTVLVFGLGFLVPIFIVGLNLVGILSARRHPTLLAMDGVGGLPVRRDRHTDRRPAEHDAAGRSHAAADPPRLRDLLAERPSKARRRPSRTTSRSPTTKPVRSAGPWWTSSGLDADRPTADDHRLTWRAARRHREPDLRWGSRCPWGRGAVRLRDGRPGRRYGW